MMKEQDEHFCFDLFLLIPCENKMKNYKVAVRNGYFAEFISFHNALQ